MSTSGRFVSKKNQRNEVRSNISQKSQPSSMARSTKNGQIQRPGNGIRSSVTKSVYSSNSKSAPAVCGKRINQPSASKSSVNSYDRHCGEWTPSHHSNCTGDYGGCCGTPFSGEYVDCSCNCSCEESSCRPRNDGCGDVASERCCCTPSYDNCECCDDPSPDAENPDSETVPPKVEDEARPDTVRCLSPVPSVIDSCTSLSSVKSFPSFDADPELSVDDIRKSLSQHVTKRYGDIIKACRNFDVKSTEKLTQTQLRQVVRTFCMPLTAAQYRKLTEGLDADGSGRVNYVEFFKGLCSGTVDVPDDEILSEDPDLTLEEITVKIHRAITPRLHDVIRSFWLFDFNKDSHVKKADLRKVLENYCFKLTNTQFRDLWSRYEKKDTGLIEYTEFLKKLGTHVERIKSQFPKLADEQELLWEQPCGKLDNKLANYKSSRFQAVTCKTDDPSVLGLLEDDVEQFLRYKLSVCGELIEKVLRLADYKNEGQVPVDALHDTLNCFAMPMSASLFRTVLSRLEVRVKPISNSVDIQDFVDRFCQPNPDARKSEAKQQLKASSCSQVVDRIINTVLNPRQAIEDELVKAGKSANDVITRSEVKRLVAGVLKYPMTDEEYKELTCFLDPKHENAVNCGKLVSLFETDHTPYNRKMDWCYCPRPSELGLAPEELKDRYRHLTGGKLLSKIKYYVNKNRKTIDHALLVCDPDRSTLIRPLQMKLLLNYFCFPLTDDQFDSLALLFDHHGDRFDYVKFMKIFDKQIDEDSAKWREMVDKLARYKTDRTTDVTPEEVEEMLWDAVRTKRNGMERDLRKLDPCKLGFAYKNDVKAVLSKYVMRMTDAQFEHLWRKFPVNESNCLLFEKFFERFKKEKPAKVQEPITDSKEEQEPEMGSTSSCKSVFKPPRDPEEAIKERKKKLVEASKAGAGKRVVSGKNRNKPPEGNKAVQDIAFKEFPHLKKTYEAIRGPIIKNLGMLRQHFRRLDKPRTGRIHFTVLKNLLSKYNVNLSSEDAYYIQAFFDTDLSGLINYHDFMRLFAWYA